jgi:hypothetical protein
MPISLHPAVPFFSPLSFVPVFGSGILDPGSRVGKNQDPGSEINIPDPQHCPFLSFMEFLFHAFEITYAKIIAVYHAETKTNKCWSSCHYG